MYLWDGQGHSVGVGWTGAQCINLWDGQGHSVGVGWTGAQCRCEMDRGTVYL